VGDGERRRPAGVGRRWVGRRRYRGPATGCYRRRGSEGKRDRVFIAAGLAGWPGVRGWEGEN